MRGGSGGAANSRGRAGGLSVGLLAWGPMDPQRLQWKAISKAGRGARALFSRVPKAEAVRERIGWLLRRKLGGKVANVGGGFSLELHPAASVRLGVPGDGVLELTCDVTSAGPGLASYALTVVEQLFDEIDFVWPTDAAAAGASPREPAALQQGFGEWVQAQVRAARSGGARQLGMPASPAYEVAAAVLTPLGPRDEPWCEAVLADPEAARDGWPLWQPAGEAELARARALWALWMEVPWREPVTDEDQALLVRVHRELAAAHKRDAKLELPWAEWAQLLDHADLDDELAAEISARSQGQKPTAGYHRYAARVELAHGWSLRVPPRCVWTSGEDGESLQAMDGERSLRCTCAESPGDVATSILAKIPMRADVVERFEGDGQVGRAEVRQDEDHYVSVMSGIMTTDDHAAVLTVLTLPGDTEWGLEVWRSLRRAPRR